MVRMNQHPAARYITLLWQDTCGINPAVWYVGCGTAAYDPSYNFLGPISIADYHQDNGFDINGIPTSVIDGTPTGFASDYWSLEIVNLNTLSTSAITSKQLQLPCGVAYGGPGCTSPFLSAKSDHISMTGTWSSLPGYALVSYLTEAGSTSGTQAILPLATTLGTAVTSTGVNTVTPASMTHIGVGTQQVIDCGTGVSCNTTAAETVTVTAVTSTTFTATFTKTHSSSATVSNITTGDTGPYALENIAVKIDTTAASGSSASVWRLSRAMSIRDADYNAEPHTTVNRDWTQYLWGGNWNTDNGPDDGYWTKLTVSGTRHQITVTKAGTGDGATTPGSGPYLQGSSYTFTGTPFSGSTGPTWSGTCGATGSSSTVTITAPSSDCTVIATYGTGTPSYTLTVSTTTGTGTGTINITNNCQTGSFASGTTIGPCTATPNAGSVFAGWTGTLGCTGTGTCTASLTGNSTMNAVFNLAPTSAPATMQGIGSIQGTAVIQ